MNIFSQLFDIKISHDLKALTWALGLKTLTFYLFLKTSIHRMKSTQKKWNGESVNCDKLRLSLVGCKTPDKLGSISWIYKLYVGKCIVSIFHIAIPPLPVLNKYLRIFPSYCNSWVTSCTSQVYYHVTCIHAVFQTRVQFALAQVHVCPHCERRYLSSNILVSIVHRAAATRVQSLDVHLSKFASSKYVAACVRDAIRQSPMQLTS